jgi:hypothetical protein
MPIHSSLPFSKEVYEYLRASESLVAIALTRPQSFSDEELQIGARRHIARNDLCLPTNNLFVNSVSPISSLLNMMRADPLIRRTML